MPQLDNSIALYLWHELGCRMNDPTIEEIEEGVDPEDWECDEGDE